jgi:RNA polymerase sigma factor (sigma-70 family)
MTVDGTYAERWPVFADELVTRLFVEEGARLVRMARFFVDDRAAAEDVVQEAFIRLARSAHRIRDEARATAYLRSIVLNQARDWNRRGLLSLRHSPPPVREPDLVEEVVTGREEHASSGSAGPTPRTSSTTTRSPARATSCSATSSTT